MAMLATIDTVSGDVSVARFGVGVVIPEAGAALQVGDLVTVKEGARLRVNIGKDQGVITFGGPAMLRLVDEAPWYERVGKDEFFEVGTEPIATLAGMRGAVEVVRGPDRFKAEIGMPIYLGDLVQTGHQARAELQYVDGLVRVGSVGNHRVKRLPTKGGVNTVETPPSITEIENPDGTVRRDIVVSMAVAAGTFGAGEPAPQVT